VVRRFALALVLTLLSLAGVFPPPAGAQLEPVNVPWPQLLPPAPGSGGPQPAATASCHTATLRCVDGVIRRMDTAWQPLDRSCDHRAVFALTYLITTRGFRDTLARDPHFFRDFDWIVHLDADFADLSFRAFDNYAHHRGFVPKSWRTAFDAARGDQTNAGQDIFLGMNAHIQRDLPFALAEVGLRMRDSSSRKPDHDQVNAILVSVMEHIKQELQRRYDPILQWVSPSQPFPATDQGALEVLKSWREGAWRNAERLVNARSAADRRAVAESIEDNAQLWAQSIVAGPVPGYQAIRDPYCRQAHA